jgi:hypothetical protein
LPKLGHPRLGFRHLKLLPTLAQPRRQAVHTGAARAEAVRTQFPKSSGGSTLSRGAPGCPG